MKKIIDGIRYDSEKAIEIGTGYSDANPGDHQYWRGHTLRRLALGGFL